MADARDQNDGFRNAAMESAKARRDEVVRKVRETITMLEDEIEKNHGVYPHPGVKLGQREFCRRAEIHFQTLQAPSHKDTTRREVEEFCNKHKQNRTKRAIKEAVTQKVDFWKSEHDKVATQIHLYELELNERDFQIRTMKADLAKSVSAFRDEVARLTAENDSLRQQLSAVVASPNVTALRSRGK